MRISPISNVVMQQRKVGVFKKDVSEAVKKPQEVTFGGGNKIKTATGALCAIAGGVVGFVFAGPPGAVVGAGLAGGAGYAMESKDSESSTGDSNFYDKRD